MVEYITVAAAGVFFGGVVADLLNRRRIKHQGRLLEEYRLDNRAICQNLLALRSNCFITNERGHRVRYVNASVECRAKAEAPKEATGWRVP